jgi:hypothetical protein
MLSPEVDSRQYVITYGIASSEEIPPDFGIPGPLDDFQAGLFVPGDQPDWFGRSRYPPRVLSLVGPALRIDAHPCAKEPHRRIPLDELVYIESGHILLRGWLRFVARGLDQTVLYSTVYRRTVDRFLRRLRARWMTAEQSVPRRSGLDFRELPDVKFRNALARELDPGELPCNGLFQAPQESAWRRLLRPGKFSTPGDLLALTPRRLLWITDRDRGTAARYGTIARYAPLRNTLKFAWEARGRGCALRIELAAGHAWHIPMPPEQRAAARWLENLYADSPAEA